MKMQARDYFHLITWALVGVAVMHLRGLRESVAESRSEVSELRQSLVEARKELAEAKRPALKEQTLQELDGVIGRLHSHAHYQGFPVRSNQEICGDLEWYGKILKVLGRPQGN